MDSSTINDEMLCPFCHSQFDDNQHLPRILSECGHTICSECISKQIIEYQRDPSVEFRCIEDNQLIEMEMININHFPKNQYLIRMIDKKATNSTKTENMIRTSQNISKISQNENINSVDESNAQILLQLDEQQQIPTNNYAGQPNNYVVQPVQSNNYVQQQQQQQSYELCQMHGKEKDVICVTEKIQICSHCALFGTHRDHLIKSIHEIQKDQAAKAQEHLNIFCQIDSISKSMADGQSQKEIKEMINEKKNRLMEQIKSSFQILHQFIDEKENVLLNQLQQDFNSIYSKHNNLQFSNQLQSQLNYYTNTVNQILIEFGNNFDNNTICYTLFSQKSEDVKQLGLQLQQESQQQMEEMIENIKDELNQEVVINQNYQMMDDFVQVVRKSSNQKNKNNLVSDLTMMQMGDDDCFDYQNKNNNQISNQVSNQANNSHNDYMQNQNNLHYNNQSMQMSYNQQYQTMQSQFSTSFQQMESQNHPQYNHHQQTYLLNTSSNSNNNHSLNRNNINQQNNNNVNTNMNQQSNNSNNNNSNMNQQMYNQQTYQNQRQSAGNNQNIQNKQNQGEKRQASGKKNKSTVRKGVNKKRLNLNFKVNPKYEPEINKLKNGTTEVIDLTQAELGDMGMQVLGEDIGLNKKMTQLKLTKNKITDEGLATLFHYLQDNETLVTLSLAGNQLSDKSIDNLLQFFSDNPQTGLRNINLCGNNNINSKKHKEKLIQFLTYGINVSTT